MEDRHLSLSEAAQLLDMSERTVRRWIKSGKLKAYKPGRDYRVPESAIGKMMEESEAYPKAPGPARQPDLEEPAGPEVLERGDASSAAVWQMEYENRLDEMLDRWEDQLEERVEALAAGEIEAFFLWLDEIERYGRPQVSGIVAAHTATAAHELEAVIRMSPFKQAWGDLWRSIEEAKRRHGVSLSPEDERRFQEHKERSLADR